MSDFDKMNNKDKKTKIGIALGTPVIVFDTKTDKLSEYASISEAARALNTYPKAISRKVYNNKLYLNRYRVVVRNDEAFNKIYLNGVDKSSCKNKGLRQRIYVFEVIKGYSILIFRLLLSVIFGVIVCMFISRLILVCKDVYCEYIIGLHKIKANYLKHLMEYRCLLNNSCLINSSREGFIFINQEFSRSKLIDSHFIF